MACCLCSDEFFAPPHFQALEPPLGKCAGARLLPQSHDLCVERSVGSSKLGYLGSQRNVSAHGLFLLRLAPGFRIFHFLARGFGTDAQ